MCTFHTAICIFKSVDEHLRSDQSYCVYSPSWKSPSCASQLILRRLRAYSSRTVNTTKPEAIVVACHGLEDFIPLVTKEMGVTDEERQFIFDFVWENYCGQITDWWAPSIVHSQRRESLMQLLIDEGCDREGRHLCTLSRQKVHKPSDWMVSFMLKHIPDDKLSHDLSCKFADGGLLGFIDEIGGCWSSPSERQVKVYENMVYDLVGRGADLGHIDLCTGEPFLVRQIQRARYEEGFPYNFEGWLKLLLDAGADPHQKGRSGDAFEAASSLRDYCLEGIDTDIIVYHENCDSDCEDDIDDTINLIHEIRDIFEVLEQYRRY